jgi:general secretion pathway protein D
MRFDVSISDLADRLNWKSADKRLVLNACLFVILGACSQFKSLNPATTPTFDPKIVNDGTGDVIVPRPVSEERTGTTPRVPLAESAAQTRATKAEDPVGEPIEITAEQMPLPVFARAVFSDALKYNVILDPTVAGKTDIVTMRTGGPRKPKDLLELAEMVLKTYGLRVIIEGKSVRIVTDQAALAEAPSILVGRNSAEAPSQMRPVFQIIPVNNLLAQEVIVWLQVAYGSKIKLQPAPSINAILVLGLPDEIRSITDAVRLLDQPKLAGQQSIRFEPIFWTSPKLVEKLVQILKAEGYQVSANNDASAPATLISIDVGNALLAFAPDPKLLRHIEQWCRDLDQPSKVDPTRTTFVYSVKNTSADSLAAVLDQVVGGVSGASQTQSSSQRSGLSTTTSSGGFGGTSLGGSTQVASTPTTQSAPQFSGSGNGANSTDRNQTRFVVDSARNSIIVVGNAEAYSNVRPLLESLDVPPKEALIEVTVAEVTLNEQTKLGIEWALGANPGGGTTGTLGSLGGLGVLGTTASSTPTGFTYRLLNGAGNVRAIVNALATNSAVNILSTPRVISRSGSEATIQVGTEVPTVTSQSTSSVAIGGNTGILQQVSYRSTGVILKVKPVVHAGDIVDLDISQEVSEAQANTLSTVDSPAIFRRTIATSLSMKDGATVLLGGLISENKSNGETGLPYVQDIPILGNLFRSQSAGTRKTELLIFITPYIVRNGNDAERITNEFRKQLNQWPPTTGELRY